MRKILSVLPVSPCLGKCWPSIQSMTITCWQTTIAGIEKRIPTMEFFKLADCAAADNQPKP